MYLLVCVGVLGMRSGVDLGMFVATFSGTCGLQLRAMTVLHSTECICSRCSPPVWLANPITRLCESG
jgi:hypothetical protein